MDYREGDAVEVWSKTRHRWARGSIVSIDISKEKGAAPGGGEVKVKLDDHGTFLDPGEFDQLRHCVIFEALPVDREALPASCLRSLRRCYFTTEAVAVSLQDMRVTMATLVKVWRDSLEDPALRLSSEERDLIHQRVKISFQELRSDWSLGRDDSAASVNLCEWLHQALMRIHHPGPAAAKRIASELAAGDPKMLPQLVKRWMQMDISGSGFISKSALTEVFKQDYRPKRAFHIAQKMALGMLRDLDEKGLGRASYSEFVLTSLGISCTEVVLYWYDLSNDWAKYLSPLLLGSWEGGLWHTGISAFGREYFYGGRICWGPAGATVWGRPTRALRLGLTTRKLDDLREHIYKQLDKRFDRKSYDVLDRNCNHFADEAAQFFART